MADRMASRVTRCPKCSTSFRITDEQLLAAKGAVRCGSCLHIFKALAHIVHDQPATTPAPSESQQTVEEQFLSAQETPEEAATTDTQENTLAETTEAEPVAQKPVTQKETADTGDNRLQFDQAVINDDDDDLLISDDMDDDASSEKDSSLSLGDDLSSDFLTFQAKSSSSLFEREVQDEDDSETDSHDDSWAEGLLDDDENDNSRHATEPDNTSQLDYSHKTTGSFQALDDDQLESILGESLNSRPEPRFSLAPEEAEEELAEFKHELEEEAYDVRHDMLERIQPATVEFEPYQIDRVWPARLLWGGLSLLGMILLIGQISYFKFDYLSRIEPYRQAYATVCPLLGCKLPSLSDHTKIKTRNLVIRSHPSVENALVVDAIIFNSAAFEQPFPKLILTFTDLNNQVVANRQFEVDEYLGGELAGSTVMPSNTPIHLSLEIVDPGQDAINYRLDSAP